MFFNWISVPNLDADVIGNSSIFSFATNMSGIYTTAERNPTITAMMTIGLVLMLITIVLIILNLLCIGKILTGKQKASVTLGTGIGNCVLSIVSITLIYILNYSITGGSQSVLSGVEAVSCTAFPIICAVISVLSIVLSIYMSKQNSTAVHK